MRKTCAAIAAALVVALAGCSDDAGPRVRDEATSSAPAPSAGDTTPSGTPTPAATTPDPTTPAATTPPAADDAYALLQRAADFMEAAESVNMSLTMLQTATVSGQDMTTEMVMTGPQVLTTSEMDLTTDTTVFGQTTTTRMIVTAGPAGLTLYYTDPATLTWAQTPVTPEQVTALGLDAGFAPAVEFFRTLPADAAITSTPVSTPSGAAGTEITVPLDSAALTQLLSYNAEGMIAEGTGTYDLSVDDATGEPFRAVLTTSITDLAGMGAVEQSVDTSYSDWNAPVTITVPPEALNAPVSDTLLGML